MSVITGLEADYYEPLATEYAWKAVTLLLALILVRPHVATADELTLLRLRKWIDAVDTHAAGQADDAMSVVTAWTYEDLEHMRPYVEALVLAPLEGNRERARRRRRLGSDAARILALTRSLQGRGDFDAFRKRAALLHTDAALLGSMPIVTFAPSPRARSGARQDERRLDVKSFDGKVTHFELQNLHWEFAMDVLESLPAKPTRDPFVGQWYRAIGAYFARERQFADALRHFEQARSVVPGDPGVLYGEACLQETLGAPRIQDYVRVTTLPNGLLILGVSSPATHFRRAETLLRKALGADPQFLAAELRLGRVLSQLDRHDEALTHLRTVGERSDDPATTYYAYLFAGDAAHALGRLDDARRSYENAIAVFPDAQAARLALGSVLRSHGDRAAALEAIDTMLRTPSRGPDDDPWWEYYDGDGALVDVLLEDVRKPFARPR
jgi:tetratricopeptide (TPR) repeat protein